MTTASEHSKAVRGTKRLCAACEVRFYDLSRDPIVCPACAAVFTPAPIVEVTARGASAFGKTAWRSKGFKRPDVPLPVASADDAAPEAGAAKELEDEVEAAPGADAEDDIVLEPEADDADVSELVDVDVEEPKDR